MHNPPSHPRAAPSGPHLQVITRSVRQATRNDNPLPSPPPSHHTPHLTHRGCYQKKQKKKTRRCSHLTRSPSAQRPAKLTQHSTAQRIIAQKHATCRAGTRGQTCGFVWNGTQEDTETRYTRDGDWPCRVCGFAACCEYVLLLCSARVCVRRVFFGLPLSA